MEPMIRMILAGSFLYHSCLSCLSALSAYRNRADDASTTERGSREVNVKLTRQFKLRRSSLWLCRARTCNIHIYLDTFNPGTDTKFRPNFGTPAHATNGSWGVPWGENVQSIDLGPSGVSHAMARSRFRRIRAKNRKSANARHGHPSPWVGTKKVNS
jgi:hypothetical protein